MEHRNQSADAPNFSRLHDDQALKKLADKILNELWEVYSAQREAERQSIIMRFRQLMGSRNTAS